MTSELTKIQISSKDLSKTIFLNPVSTMPLFCALCTCIRFINFHCSESFAQVKLGLWMHIHNLEFNLTRPSLWWKWKNAVTVTSSLVILTFQFQSVSYCWSKWHREKDAVLFVLNFHQDVASYGTLGCKSKAPYIQSLCMIIDLGSRREFIHKFSISVHIPF
jgi:hypothetical protein